MAPKIDNVEEKQMNPTARHRSNDVSDSQPILTGEGLLGGTAHEAADRGSAATVK